MESDMLERLHALEVGAQRNARAAVRDGTNKAVEILQKNTPVSDGHGDGKWKQARSIKSTGHIHLADETMAGTLSTSTGKLEQQYGYGEAGWREHFPNNGTIHQRPQHFVEKSIDEAREPVLAEFVKHMKLGD